MLKQQYKSYKNKVLVNKLQINLILIQNQVIQMKNYLKINIIMKMIKIEELKNYWNKLKCLNLKEII